MRVARCLVGCRATTVFGQRSLSHRFGWVTGNLVVERPVGKVGVSRAVAECCTAASTCSVPIAGEL